MKRLLIILIVAWPLTGVTQTATEPAADPEAQKSERRYIAISGISDTKRAPFRTAILVDTLTGKSWILRSGQGSGGTPTFTWAPIGFPMEPRLPAGINAYPR